MTWLRSQELYYLALISRQTCGSMVLCLGWQWSLCAWSVGEDWVSLHGESIASKVGDCALKLGCPKEAVQWYQIALHGRIGWYGDNDPSQPVILLKLATLNGSEHGQGESLQLAQKGIRIYQGDCRDGHHRIQPTPNRFFDLEVVIALYSKHMCSGT